MEEHLKVIGSQFVDQAALANIGDANHKQGAVRPLGSVPSDHQNVLVLMQRSSQVKRPVLSTNKFGHCGDDGRRFRTVEGLAVGKEHS